jgi:hypothetical protein
MNEERLGNVTSFVLVQDILDSRSIHKNRYKKVTQDTETHNNKQELHQINVSKLRKNNFVIHFYTPVMHVDNAILIASKPIVTDNPT